MYQAICRNKSRFAHTKVTYDIFAENGNLVAIVSNGQYGTQPYSFEWRAVNSSLQLNEVLELIAAEQEERRKAKAS